MNSYFEFNEKSTNSYVFLEKTFPKLKSFTISTWLQIQNYEKKYIRKDVRTIFSYSIGKKIIDFTGGRCFATIGQADEIKNLKYLSAWPIVGKQRLFVKKFLPFLKNDIYFLN